MKIKPVGKNQTLLIKDNNDEVFFSYETPVCCFINGRYIKTSKKWSMTTSKHINAYLPAGITVIEKDQSFFDTL